MSCKIQVNSVCFEQHVTAKINVNNSKSCSYGNGRVKTFFQKNIVSSYGNGLVKTLQVFLNLFCSKTGQT